MHGSLNRYHNSHPL
uniref:YJU2 splicing factor homolog B n=5 Tax=Rodentia TaxID=9989 RepID=A0A287DA10_ICTTR